MNILTRVRNFFSGPPGPPGEPGCMGMKGEINSADNVRCPHCRTFREAAWSQATSPESSPKPFKLIDEHKVHYTCLSCGGTSSFKALSLMLLPESLVECNGNQ